MATKGKMSERLTMKGQIHKAYKVMLKLINPRYVSKDKAIPLKILQNAKGIAFITTVRAGFVFTGTLGSGIVIAKLEDGTWTGPSSLGVGGMGWGLQIGGTVTDSVIILNSRLAVKAFSGKGQIKFGGNLSVAAGPVGRDGDAAVNLGDGGVAACYSYSHARGAFAGLSLQGAILFARDSDNAKFYGTKVTPTAILNGIVTPPENEDLRLLYSTLQVVNKSKTSNFEYRDSRTGSLRFDGNLEDDSMPSEPSFYAQDSAASLGPSFDSTPYAEEIYEHDTGEYHNPYSTTSSFQNEDDLPPGWKELKAPNGQKYFWNESTNTTQWERPMPVATQKHHASFPPTPSAPAIPRPSQEQIQNATGKLAQGYANTSYGQNDTSPEGRAIKTVAQSSFAQQAAASALHQQIQQQGERQSFSTHSKVSAPSSGAAADGVSGGLADELQNRLSMHTADPSSSRPSVPPRQPSSQPMAPPRESSLASRPAPPRPKIPVRPPSTRTVPPPRSTQLENRPSPVPAAAAAQSAISPVYTYDQVVNREVPEMDSSRLEEYLTNEEFTRVFKMDRSVFQSQPKWKKDREKKQVNLF